tara:strand:- start:74 stop:1348 length:1275 start_codon:yes stop_codon:yes gene_type:complete
MSDLNLNFDTGVKSVTMGNTPSADNLSIKQGDNSPMNSPINSPQPQQTTPSLSVSDPVGIEFLAKGSNSPSQSAENTPKSNKEEFSFFKPTEEPKVEEIPPSGKSDTDDMLANPKQADTSEFKPIHRLTPQDIKNEKIDLLYKFKKLENQGIRTTMNYNMNSHLEDMRNEYIKLKKQREIDNSIKFQRKMLMACVTGIEFLNNRFDPFSVNLDGWGESVNENLNDYDEIFEELGEKYGGGGDMAPELRLLFTLAGSAFMFHLSNTMFKSSIPGMDDVLQQNPELMKQFAEAAVGSMNKGPGMGGMPQQQQQQRPPEPPNPLAAMMGLGGGGGGGGNPLGGLMGGLMGGMMGGAQQGGSRGPPQGVQQRRPTSPARSDMSGPDGIDDLINKMNLQPDKIPDLDAISLMSGDTDKKSTDRGITLNL